MGNRQFVNNATSILAATITNSATVVQVSSGEGSLFPTLSGSEYFNIAVEDTTGDVEYMKCTSISGDNLTVVRAQEGSTALPFTADLARVELRADSGAMNSFYQKDGDTLTGPLAGGGQTATNLVLGSGCSMEGATEIVNTPIRGTTGTTANELVVPTDGSRATAGGLRLLCAGDVLPVFTIGMIMAWNASIPDIPAGWQICDGTNGTPDLRNNFVVGAGATYALGNTGGSASGVTGAGGSVAAGVTGSHVLLVTELPSHNHEFWQALGSQASGSGQHFADTTGGAYSNTITGGPDSGQQIIQNTGGGAGHTHTTPAVPTHTHTTTLPPYYALYYIQFVGT